MRYEVTPDLITDNRLIDSEHRQLFDAVNKLLDAMSDPESDGGRQIGQTADFLRSYVDKHFAHEEELQRKHDWREYETHVRFHEQYKKTLCEILDSMPTDGTPPSVQNMSELNVHIVRLIKHISTMDKRLGAYLKSRGEA